MSQNPRVNSDTQLSKTPTLKPVLAAALASLEVQLDRELARYRRTRNTSRLPNSARVISYVGSSPQAIAAAIMEQSQAAQTKPSIPPSVAPSVTADTPAMEAVTEPAELDEMDHLLLSSTPEVTQTPPPPPPPPVNPTTSIIPTGQSQQNSNGLKADDTPIEPEDYLESSEALLRSVTDEEPQKKKPSTANDGLLSPLGIGSMLLLLVASLTLGYVIFNPKGLTHLNLSKLFSSQSSTSTTPTEKTTVPVGNTPAQPEPVLTPIPKYPNLATKEFPEVNDPNDVVGLQPKGQETPRTAPNPVPIQPVNPPIQPPTQVAPPQAVNPLTVAPSPQAQPVTPSTPTSSQTLPNPQLKPSADGFYHVVIDNESDRTFASVRRVVPDAYLSTDNKFIFLGAFKTQKEVQKQLQLLEKNGIQARVQQP
ncbi:MULTISPECIES: hypothetical protein [Calothrix]|uniref:SPOR domain-containing protein n=2 Tax=Calothrix TaxID=1186 RepID=A0ABR8AI74_9CYAN|nr:MULTISPECIES: hypothetical protein [Calothrix]MBD2199230.1 hypothetical protein [Calothrix parietina FACHB-288]MBD2227932.1 hypothetical protein [Calothrix anomala FACHB-343]